MDTVCLNVESFLYFYFGKKESERIKITVGNDAFHNSLRQTVDEFFKGAGLKSRGGVSHDQWK